MSDCECNKVTRPYELCPSCSKKHSETFQSFWSEQSINEAMQENVKDILEDPEYYERRGYESGIDILTIPLKAFGGKSAIQCLGSDSAKVSFVIGTLKRMYGHIDRDRSGIEKCIEALRSDEACLYPAKDGWGPKQHCRVWADWLEQKFLKK